MNKGEVASPTVSTESILLMVAIEAKENRDVMTIDVPNADSHGIVKKVTGALVEMLVEMAPDTYKEYINHKGRANVVYMEVLKAIYGMLHSSVLFYKKLKRSDSL